MDSSSDEEENEGESSEYEVDGDEEEDEYAIEEEGVIVEVKHEYNPFSMAEKDNYRALEVPKSDDYYTRGS